MPEIFHLFLFLSGLELLLLVELLLQHFMKLLEIFSLTLLPRSFLRSDISLQFGLFLVPTIFDTVGDQS